MGEISIWRTTVAPGDVTYIWKRSGGFPHGKGGGPIGGNTFSLDDSIPLAQFYWGNSYHYEDPAYATGLRVPVDATQGTYHLHIRGNDTQLAITVLAPPPPKPTANINPSGGPDSGAIQAALNAGNSVQLSAGVYHIDSTITIPGGAFVRGAHRDATILRLHKEGDYSDRIFTASGDNIAISDMTADGTLAAPRAMFFENSPKPINGVVMQRLRLLHMGSIIGIMPGALVEDVLYDYSGGWIGGAHQLWKDIRFQGMTDGNECIAQGDQFALFNASWQDTGRGLILRAGPTNSYFNSLTFNGIQQVLNGGEMILVEDLGGVGLNNCLFNHIRIWDCVSWINFWRTGTLNNLFRFVQMDGGGGIMFAPGEEAQTNNHFESVELRGCVGIHMGGAKGNSFKGLAIISPRPSWSNQGFFTTSFYNASAAITGSDGNSFNPVVILDLPEGWKQMD